MTTLVKRTPWVAGRTVGRARVFIQLAIVFGPVAFQTLHVETMADDDSPRAAPGGHRAPEPQQPHHPLPMSAPRLEQFEHPGVVGLAAGQ